MQLLYYNLIGVFIVQLSPPFPPRISAIKAGESPMEFVSEASRLKVYKAVFEPKVTQDASELGVGVVFVS